VKSAVETLEPTKVKLTVEVSEQEVAAALKVAYREIAKQINVPGFRRGKVPDRIIDQRVGFSEVLDFAVNESLNQWYGQAVKDCQLHPLDRPVVDVVERPESPGQAVGLTFTATVEIRPTLDLPDLSSLKITIPTATVTDEDVENGLTSLRERFATLRGVDRPAGDNDFVSIDLRATIGDKEIDSVSGVSYQIGSQTMLDGLDEALNGLSAGETTTFEAPLAGGEHEGEQGLVEVSVQSVKERELPELDDEFAELASSFDTVAELRQDMAKRLQSIKQMGQHARAQEGLVEALLEAVEIPVPAGVRASFLEQELAQAGPDAEERKAEIEAEVDRQLRTDLLLDTLAEKMSVEVSQNDLVQYMAGEAERLQMDPSEFVERVDSAGQIPRIVSSIARRKAVIMATAQAVVVDEAGVPFDAAAALPQDPDADIEFDDDEEETEQ
jgi:trigger factor